MSRGIAALAITAVLAGCSTLPRDGPTGRNVVRGASNVSAAGGYAILDLTYAASEAIKAAPPAYFGSLQDGASTDAPPTIGSGDVLAVSIFEPSGGLFAGARNSGATVSSSNETLPAIVVDGSGAISIPFAGPVQVAGLTPAQAASAIRRALIGKVANPQVVVSISQNAYNTVTVIGAVRSPGRAPLSSNTDRLIDAIAARGGTERAPEDVQVAIVRDGQTFFAPLSLVNTRFEENIRLKRGDQINLIYQPRRFSTFGALGAVALTSMETGSTSLADAISRVGGLDTNSANARSVLVFRFERPEVASALGVTQPARSRGVPIVYRLNLEQAEGFFIASNFEIQPDDILYVPRSGSAELGKFFTLVRSLSGVVSDISIANTLNNN
ncbi:MAG: polysaccharide export protein [Zymomonas sp.]|nr:MAG: polysaccharide export protein [Zymomonas sp.]